MMEVTLQLNFYTQSMVHLIRLTSSALETLSLCHLSLNVASQRTASRSHIPRLKVRYNDFYFPLNMPTKRIRSMCNSNIYNFSYAVASYHFNKIKSVMSNILHITVLCNLIVWLRLHLWDMQDVFTTATFCSYQRNSICFLSAL